MDRLLITKSFTVAKAPPDAEDIASLPAKAEPSSTLT